MTSSCKAVKKERGFFRMKIVDTIIDYCVPLMLIVFVFAIAFLIVIPMGHKEKAQEEACNSIGLYGLKYVSGLSQYSCVDRVTMKRHFVEIDCNGKLYDITCWAGIVDIGTFEVT